MAQQTQTQQQPKVQLTDPVRRAVQIAQQLAVKYEQERVDDEGLLFGLIEEGSEGGNFLGSVGVELEELRQYILRHYESKKPDKRFFQRVDYGSKVSESFNELTTKGMMIGRHQYNDTFLSSDVLIMAFFECPNLPISQHLMTLVSKEQVMAKLNTLRSGSKGVQGAVERTYDYLEQFGTNLTARARAGAIDPIIGRDKEVREMVQILSRKSKNNPVLVGKPGVGKTALVEGLARRIAMDDVPENLQRRQLYSINLGQMLSGSTLRGQFEERFEGLLNDVRRSNGQVILFIDELHTLMGAGGEGAGDAAQLIKPALARGEFMFLGATTDEEYREYIEPDKALDRRFQRVNVEEPTVEDAVSILRGLKESLEAHHRVTIHDEAFVSAVELSDRYIKDRYLPDKAIDLIDQACAEIKVTMNTMPEALDQLNRGLLQLEIEEKALSQEYDASSQQRLQEVRGQIGQLKERAGQIHQQWTAEKQMVDQIGEVRDVLKLARHNLEQARADHNVDEVSRLETTEIPQYQRRMNELTAQFEQLSGGQPLIHDAVTSDQVAEVLSARTGIPLNKLNGGDKETLLNLADDIKQTVIGQDEAVEAVSNAVIRSRVGLHDPDKPLASFMFLGTSGSGKTHLAKTLSDFVFDGEESMIRLDMSEFMEEHSVSRLIGAPPGYVGHEAGGYLTEAVRAQPYSLVLFDEVEKAHPKVFDVLLQLLDDGRLTDSKGVTVDFKNTIVVLTSNIGSRLMMADKEAMQTGHVSEGVRAQVRKELEDHFRPEFLNRIDDVIIFNMLSMQVVANITKNLLIELSQRLAPRYNIAFTNNVLRWVATSAYDPAMGARPLKRFITDQIETPFSMAVLQGTVQEGVQTVVDYDVNNDRVVFR